MFNSSCPCAHVTPCNDRCTCVNPLSSSGCRRCCSYGSAEQQKTTAEHLVENLDFDSYQKRALARAIYPNVGDNLSYPTLGLCGEAGEVAEKVKKIIRDHRGGCSDDDRRLLIKELGDVLWYIAAIAQELRSDLSEVAKMNLEKVDGRHERGTLGGSGDDR